MAKEIAEEYASSLADLTVNSKPLINMLTILAEENIEHAGVIVDTVEKHLEKVHPEIKLPVLYLVDSIIKNVGGAYTQKFSQSIVNMFTRTFKQVDEKTRSQMFKLRETWHEVFPATKLYQLDVKVNLIDHAWPIQAQPQQSNIHVNPNFLKKPAATTSVASPVPPEEDEKIRTILAKKEQELLMLQRKKVEMELEQTRRQLELAEKNVKKVLPTQPVVSTISTPAVPVPQLTSVVTPVMPEVPASIPVKQRLGPPVNKPLGRIAPVSGALAGARRDPRLARRAPPPAPAAPAAPTAPPSAAPAAPPPTIASNVFDIKPLERVTKRSNAITIDVRPEPRRAPPKAERVRPRRPERPERPERPADEPAFDAYLDRLQVADPKKVTKLPPIPKLPREEPREEPAPPKRRKEAVRERKKRREAKEPGATPDKRRTRERRAKPKPEPDERAPEPEVVAFKELKNYNKERYMRRNKQKSESPERPPDPANVPEVVDENKDVDLRVLHPVIDPPAAVAQKRPSTETLEGKVKKNKLDKFDILFGNEDVDLRQLPQVDEVAAPPPPTITESPKVENANNVSDDNEDMDQDIGSPVKSPKKDWHEVKEKEEAKKPTPSKLDLVRAKLAEATKGKDRLGRPLLFSKSPSIEKERRRTLSSEDTDLRNENSEEFDAEDHKKTISIIMSQAKEQFKDGQLDKNQYNTLMYQVLQLNEKLKLKEAKQRESLENSKRKLKAHIEEENHKVPSPRSSPSERNNFGDIDERVTPAPFAEPQHNNQDYHSDSDMRLNQNNVDGKPKVLLPFPPMAPMYMGPYPAWRGPRRFRPPPGPPMPPFFRGKFDKRMPRPPFDPRMPMMPPVLPTPTLGMGQGQYPLQRYERIETPPPLGAPGIVIPPTDIKILEYIDQDPVKTIQIDGVPREIRFYDETAVIMLEWDDPREIKFLPGCRRITFDNKDSIVISFNEGYKQVEIDDQVFDIRFGAPTRELFINGRWFECFFGGQPLGVIIDGKPRLVHLEGPPPQVDIGKVKRTDLVAGKINLIINATHMCPVYLDAKVQKFHINGQFFTIRFVDALRTVLINEQPFRVEFGDLPKPIFLGNEKYFIRFSALPRNIKAGHVNIVNMEGSSLPFALPAPAPVTDPMNMPNITEMEVDHQPERPKKSPSPEGESQGLDMLASVMPTSLEPAASSEYSLAEPLFSRSDHIPGIDADGENKPNPLAILGNINVNDLFAKLVATGIVSVPEAKPVETQEKVEDAKTKPKEDKSVIHKVDLLRSETLRIPQPGLVARLYGGMQCSGCGARFPPEHTVRYSQHLDWHFRQNRRERDSARRAHSRHWHYDLSDWVQYEEVEDLEEREKSWFETGGAEEAAGAAAGEPPAEVSAAAPATPAPAAHTCALCGDRFHQFYNEDKEEWHLRNALLHDQRYYHPLCLDDYKASLAKDEPAAEAEAVEPEEVEEAEKVEAIEIKDVDDGDASDCEVEVVEPTPVPIAATVELDEEEEEEKKQESDDGDEDDVVLKPEPVEQVTLDDDDTDDETADQRRRRDEQHAADFANVKIKQEPIDPDDEPIITEELHSVPHSVETTHTSVISSIDGNIQFTVAPPPAQIPVGGIRINISKSVNSFVNNNQDDRALDDISADDEPLPPGEEPELEYTLKPNLEGIKFSRQPPVQKGSELSALCSIM